VPVGEKALVSGQGDQGGQGFVVGVAEMLQVEQVVGVGQVEVAEVGFNLFAPLGGG
jgi:hypothetical protein